MSRYVRCVNGFEGALTLGKVYPVISDPEREAEGSVTVADDRGDVCCWPVTHFLQWLDPEEVDELEKARAYREAVEAEGQQRIEGME